MVRRPMSVVNRTHQGSFRAGKLFVMRTPGRAGRTSCSVRAHIPALVQKLEVRCLHLSLHAADFTALGNLKKTGRGGFKRSVGYSQ
jgi:hypothetical protein